MKKKIQFKKEQNFYIAASHLKTILIHFVSLKQLSKLQYKKYFPT